MKKGNNVLGILLSIVVIIAFFVLELMLGVERPVNKTMRVENLSMLMEKINIERIFRDEKGVLKPQGKRIYAYFEDIGLPRDDVDEVVKDKAFKRIIGNYLGTMFVHEVTGTGVVYPTKAELVNFIHNNYNRFQKVTDFPEEYDQEEITRIVNENYKNVKYELDELSKDINWDKIGNVSLVKKIMGTKEILIIGGLVLCIALLIVFRRSPYAWLKWVTIPTILSGLITFTGGVVGKPVIKLFADFTNYEAVLNPIVDDILSNMRHLGLIEMVLGIAAIIVYLIVNKIVNRPRKGYPVSNESFESNNEVEEKTEKVEEVKEESKKETKEEKTKKETKEEVVEEEAKEEKTEEVKKAPKKEIKKATKKSTTKKTTKKSSKKKSSKK